MAIKSIRGTHDILPGSVELWQRIEATARRLFRLYGFAEIRTPVFEETQLFARSIGAATDIVKKEMYTFQDSRDKSVTLRPEGTAPVVRACIEHNLFHSGEAVKVFYTGPMFRRERPQKGRYRQFHQIGAEVLGTTNPAVEAEVIDMLLRFLDELEIRDYRLLVNSVGDQNCRPAYVKRLRSEVERRLDDYCRQCRERVETNPLRVLDCKTPSCQPLIAELPTIQDFLCDACRDHFARFLKYLDLQAIEYAIDPRLVRGLDYYVRTTFEIISDGLGPTQNALLGGGRYDGLAELLGGPSSPGFGFALGMERFILVMSGRDQIQGEYEVPAPQLFVAYFDEKTLSAGLALAQQLRSDHISVYLDFEGRSLKAQLRMANRMHAHFTCVVGEDEIESGRFTIKRMSDGYARELKRTEIASYIRSELNIPAANDTSTAVPAGSQE